jgi:hypothetical protein
MSQLVILHLPYNSKKMRYNLGANVATNPTLLGGLQ